MMNMQTQTSAPNTTVTTSVSPLDLSGSLKTKFSKNKSQTRTDIYQTVTDSIIDSLESGVKPWMCPWVRNGVAAGLPANLSAGTACSGINIMLLWCSAAKQGFQDPRWLTYKQAQELGAQVRKGEHGTTAIFYKTQEKEAEDGAVEKIPMLKSFTVFNVEQIDGLSIDAVPQPERSLTRCRRLKRCLTEVARKLLKMALRHSTGLQRMKSVCRSVSALLMRRTSTRPACMSRSTGPAQRAVLIVKKGAGLVPKVTLLKC